MLEYIRANTFVTKGEGEDFSNIRLKSYLDAYNVKNRVIVIMEKYQEDAALLDSILETLLSPIMEFL